MSVSTRLVLILTLAVGAVMAAAGLLALRQREAALESAMRAEARAIAATLQISLEEGFAAGGGDGAQRMIDRLGVNSRTFGALLFDGRGELLMLSDSLTPERLRRPPELAAVLASGEPAEQVRAGGGEKVFSVILPLRDGGGRVRGAVEVVHPLSFVEREVTRARLNLAVTLIALMLTISGVVTLLMRRNLTWPIRELLGGAKALGHGDLCHRVVVPEAVGEFAELAVEFNRMADRLAEQRSEAALAAEERLALERDLRHAERLAAVGRLAAGVAHEMGAPLNVIDARAELLERRPDAPVEERARNLSIIRAQAARIAHVVRQLLNLARPYELRRSAVDLNEAAASVLEQVEEMAARAGVRVGLVRAPGPAFAFADSDFAQQALLNVCVNALQAMGAGGALTVEILPAAGRGGRGFVAARVTDTGPGIEPEHLPHIFDPFYTTKDVGQGTGLGLTVARRIVEEHGGRIEAANREGGGAAFTVYFPRHAAGAAGGGVAAAHAPRAGVSADDLRAEWEGADEGATVNR